MAESKKELILDSVIVVNTPTSRQVAAEKERKRKIRVGTMMSVAYASNIGGTGSQIGSGPQLALKGILQKQVSLINRFDITVSKIYIRLVYLVQQLG